MSLSGERTEVLKIIRSLTPTVANTSSVVAQAALAQTMSELSRYLNTLQLSETVCPDSSMMELKSIVPKIADGVKMPSSSEKSISQLAVEWIEENFSCQSGYYSQRLIGATYLAQIIELYVVHQIKNRDLIKTVAGRYDRSVSSVYSALYTFFQTNKCSWSLSDESDRAFSDLTARQLIDVCLKRFQQDILA